jgi:hypothetical protein
MLSVVEMALYQGRVRLGNSFAGKAYLTEAVLEDKKCLLGQSNGAGIAVTIRRGGRITIPRSLREYAGLKDRVLLVNMGADGFYIFDPAAHRELTDMLWRQVSPASLAGRQSLR